MCTEKTWKITRNGFLIGQRQRQHRRQRHKIKQNAMSKSPTTTKSFSFSQHDEHRKYTSTWQYSECCIVVIATRLWAVDGWRGRLGETRERERKKNIKYFLYRLWLWVSWRIYRVNSKPHQRQRYRIAPKCRVAKRRKAATRRWEAATNVYVCSKFIEHIIRSTTWQFGKTIFNSFPSNSRYSISVLMLTSSSPSSRSPMPFLYAIFEYLLLQFDSRKYSRTLHWFVCTHYDRMRDIPAHHMARHWRFLVEFFFANIL